MFLLDTDTIIYSLKDYGKINENMRLNSEAPKAISVITYGELIYGAEKSQKKHENLAKVYRISEMFPIIDISKAIMESFGELKADLSKNGIVVDDFDLAIAATAMNMGYCIVTNNTRHFSKIPGVKITNWLK